MSYPHQFGCQWCGGPYNGGNCPSCSMVESGNGSVYNQNPYSYHDTTDLFHQLPHHVIPTYSCEYCGGPHQGFECQTGNTFVYEQFPGSTQNFKNDQIPYYSPNQSQQSYCCEYCGGPHFSSDCQTGNPFPCNNYDYSYHDQPPQCQMIQATPQYPKDLCLEVLEKFKELKEELANISLRHAPSSSCAYCGGPHDDFQCQPSGFDTSTPPQFPLIPNSRGKTMAKLLAEERDSGKSMEELLAEQRAAKTRAIFRKAALLDDDDEDTLDISQFCEGSSSSSIAIPSMENQGEKTMLELLAEEQTKLINSMCASLSYLPQSALITPEVHTHSPNMGDEHLSTIPEKESDEFIKSSVENLVPIPRESQGTFDHMCDLPSPLECPKDQFETFSDSNDDCTSYGDIEYVEASLPHSDANPLLEKFADELTHINPLPSGSDDDLFDVEADLGEIESHLYHDPSLTSYPNSPQENVNHFVPEAFKTTFTNPLFEFESEFTLISDNPIFGTQIEDSNVSSVEQEFTDLHHVNDSLHEEFSGELTHIMTPPEYDSPGGDVLNHENLQIPTLPPGMFSTPKSLTFEIQTSATALDPEEEILIMIVLMTFFLFFTYSVTSSLLHSFGSEDTIFDPGIFIYHSFRPGSLCISHRCGTFTCFKCLSKHLE